MKKPSGKKENPLTVLVLDDQVRWRELVKSILENELGISPLVACNGQKALDILNSDPIDVVVTDLNMPGMSGMEFMQQARPLFPKTKFVIMTADSVSSTLSWECMARGALAVISKDEIEPDLLKLLQKL